MAIPAAGVAAWASTQAIYPAPTTTRQDRSQAAGSTAAEVTPDDPQTELEGGGGAYARDESALTDQEQRLLQQLQQRDREVRAHEMAHVAAGAGLVTRGASYTYQTGPDGQRYAVGGEVSIDTSPGRTPEETLAKAEQIRAAALAPADPSPQDRQVAAQATRMAMEARMELARQVFEREAIPPEEAGDGVDGGRPAAPAAAAPATAADTPSAYLVRQARSAYETMAGSALAARPPGLDLMA